MQQIFIVPNFCPALYVILLDLNMRYCEYFKTVKQTPKQLNRQLKVQTHWTSLKNKDFVNEEIDLGHTKKVQF